MQAEKAKYGSVYSTPEGKVAINMVYIADKVCTMVAYIDQQNAALFEAEGGKDMNLNDSDIEEEL